MMMSDRLFLAPISSSPKRILDVVPRNWDRYLGDVSDAPSFREYQRLSMIDNFTTSDIADKFPSTKVIGTDLSPITPGMQPDNCEFIIDDAASDWLWPENHFDFIHVRGMFGSLGNWPRFYEQALAATVPGGYIEQVEWSIHVRSIDNTLRPEAPLAQWTNRFLEISRLTGKEFELAESMGQHMREAGFEEIVERIFKLPIGPWSRDPHMKELGRWNLLNWEDGMEGWILAGYTRVLGVSDQLLGFLLHPFYRSRVLEY